MEWTSGLLARLNLHLLWPGSVVTILLCINREVIVYAGAYLRFLGFLRCTLTDESPYSL